MRRGPDTLSTNATEVTHVHYETRRSICWKLYELLFLQLEIVYSLIQVFKPALSQQLPTPIVQSFFPRAPCLLKIMAFNRIAVYGHRGFVGSRIVPALIASGAPITVLHRPSSDTSNLPEHVRKIEVDVLDEDALVDALQDIDIVMLVQELLAHL